jgi:hypothetical protein
LCGQSVSTFIPKEVICQPHHRCLQYNDWTIAGLPKFFTHLKAGYEISDIKRNGFLGFQQGQVCKPSGLGMKLRASVSADLSNVSLYFLQTKDLCSGRELGSFNDLGS